jgi:transposase InsO family protein
VPARTDERRVHAIATLRRLRFTGPEIAEVLAMPLSTVSGILTRIGLGSPRTSRAGTGIKRNPIRTRRDHAVGFDRKLIGWEYVHIAIDDCTRLAYAEVLPDEKASTAIAFLRRALAFYRRHGITVERVLTDNGSAYRSSVHALACKALGIRHLRTRPYRPQTNGKAERFIRTMLGGWAYGAIYRDSRERTNALTGWLDFYNHRRPHGALSHKPPIARLHERNNLLGSYS